MDNQEHITTDSDTAARIERVREAFADTQTFGEEEFSPFTSWSNWLNRG
jgi:hypothetical protein